MAEPRPGPDNTFDVFAISPEGYDVHVQLHGAQVYALAKGLLAALAADGFTPRPTTTRQSQPAKEDSSPASWCAIHQEQMRPRSANGEQWYSHKAPDGTWCRGAKPAATGPGK